MTLLNIVKKHWIFLAVLVVFLALLARNPFSARTLIPNLEPYPDTIHYLSPAYNFVSGHGFVLWREGRSFQTYVPPLYSLVMIPAFLVFHDVRMFYFMNILLALGSFLFFYLIVRKLTTNIWLQGAALFLYATNYFNYWYPTLAMGENLVIPLFLAALWTFTRKTTLSNIIWISALSIAIYATKTANLPITGGLIVGYSLKIWFEEKKDKRNRDILELAAVFLGLFVLFSAYYQIHYGSSILTSLFFFLGNLFPTAKPAVLPSGSTTSGGWFSLKYMQANLPVYLRAMLGGYPVRFLWDSTPILPLFIGAPAVAGLFAGLAAKKTRLFSLTLIMILTGSIVFMSTFYSVDMRYLYQAIPILIIGLVLGFEGLLKLRKARYYALAALVVIFGLYAATGVVRLKKQVMLNLKYSESPWYYLSVKNLNDYFHGTTKDKPYVITAMIPYYVDFYSNGNYFLLPMSKAQDFYSAKEAAWGHYNYSRLDGIYKTLLVQGRSVYVLNYLGNEPTVSRDFSALKENYKMTKVAEGCFGSCDIWRLLSK